MTTPLNVTVLAAQYDSKGYVTARWQVLPEPAQPLPTAEITDFALTIRRVRQGAIEQSTRSVEDGNACEAGLPYEFESGSQYSLTVAAYSGNTWLGSSWPPYPIENPLAAFVSEQQAPSGSGRAGSAADYRLDFVERLPYTPLFIDSGLNVVKVKLIGPDGRTPLPNQPIHWRVPPEYSGVRLYTQKPTMTDGDGIAVNRIRIDRGAELPELLTVSAWYEPSGVAAGTSGNHVCSLFESVEVRVFSSFVRDFAHPWTGGAIPRPDERVTATVTVLDGYSRPVRGLNMAWRMRPNAASGAWAQSENGDWQSLEWRDTPSYEKGFPVVTDERGRSTIRFANDGKQIMGVAPAVNNEEFDPAHAMFSEVDFGTGSQPAVKLPLDGGVLRLDKHPDTVPVTLPLEVGVSEDAAIWLNGEFVSTVFVGSITQPGQPILVPSEFFVPGQLQNQIGYIQSDGFGNGRDSILTRFGVTGKPHIPQPTPGGTLDKPRFERGGISIVNDSVIAGGLELRIPAYAGIARGDEVDLRIYLEGYYQNTAFKKYGYYKQTHGVRESDLADGFVLVVDESELRGYAASPQNEPGRFVAQYSVVSSSGGAQRYSKLLTQDLVTTVADRSLAWVAFDAPA
jgi:hypothetical protein